MSLAIIYSRASSGIDALSVTVETHISNGLPNLSIVGLPETVVKESKDRVRSAIMNSHFEFPTRRITVNLAPADLPKEGGRFDLPIALGILAASRQLPLQSLTEYEFGGELALSGELRPITGALPFSLATYKAKRQCILPSANADEAALVREASILPAMHLLDVCSHLMGKKLLIPHTVTPYEFRENELDLADVQGQPHARRALEIAAAGNHSLLMIGSPGTGKTMLASRLSSLLPEMTDAEAIEVAAIHSISKTARFNPKIWRRRPFRAPHHTASSVALVGGGNPPQPGEISLAHQGVLFLDELPEYKRPVLESLREPLESGRIMISRAARHAEFPARFQLIAAMNPCPCGYRGDADHPCRCTADQVQRYQARISGPLLDRIDMHIEVPRLPPSMLLTKSNTSENSARIRQRVIAARQRQLQRQNALNNTLTGDNIAEQCQISTEGQRLLEKAITQFGFSARSCHRILKVARTIADLAEHPHPELAQAHLLEALSYRKIDRKGG